MDGAQPLNGIMGWVPTSNPAITVACPEPRLECILLTENRLQTRPVYNSLDIKRISTRTGSGAFISRDISRGVAMFSIPLANIRIGAPLLRKNLFFD